MTLVRLAKLKRKPNMSRLSSYASLAQEPVVGVIFVEPTIIGLHVAFPRPNKEADIFLHREQVKQLTAFQPHLVKKRLTALINF